MKEPNEDRRAADYPEWAADDIDALTALVGGYAFMAAEHTIDELQPHDALGLDLATMAPEIAEQVGAIADRVSDELVKYFRQQLADNERGGT